MTNPNDTVNPKIETDFSRHTGGDTYSSGGLTKREYFAIMIMQGISANPDFVGLSFRAAKDAVTGAEALIKELNDEVKDEGKW